MEDLELHLESLGLTDEADKQLIDEKARNLFDRIPEIDQLIEAASDKWAIDRIAKIELALLRVAVNDIKYDQVPVQVAINEAVELSKKYGEDQSSKFVNGVLGQIVKGL